MKLCRSQEIHDSSKFLLFPGLFCRKPEARYFIGLIKKKKNSLCVTNNIIGGWVVVVVLGREKVPPLLGTSQKNCLIFHRKSDRFSPPQKILLTSAQARQHK